MDRYEGGSTSSRPDTETVMMFFKYYPLDGVLRSLRRVRLVVCGANKF